MENEYAEKFFYYLSNYTNLKNSQELSCEDQLFLRLWYRKECNYLTGWVTYWIKLAHYNPDFFIKNCHKIIDLDGYTDININPWKDIVCILNGLLLTPMKPENCINKLYILIVNELTDNIIHSNNNLLAQALPINNNKIPILYKNIVSYCGQTYKDWKEMIKELRVIKIAPKIQKRYPIFTSSFMNIHIIYYNPTNIVKCIKNGKQYIISTKNIKVNNCFEHNINLKKLISNIKKIYN